MNKTINSPSMQSLLVLLFLVLVVDAQQELRGLTKEGRIVPCSDYINYYTKDSGSGYHCFQGVKYDSDCTRECTSGKQCSGDLWFCKKYSCKPNSDCKCYKSGLRITHECEGVEVVSTFIDPENTKKRFIMENNCSGCDCGDILDQIWCNVGELGMMKGLMIGTLVVATTVLVILLIMCSLRLKKTCCPAASITKVIHKTNDTVPLAPSTDTLDEYIERRRSSMMSDKTMVTILILMLLSLAVACDMSVLISSTSEVCTNHNDTHRECEYTFSGTFPAEPLRTTCVWLTDESNSNQISRFEYQSKGVEIRGIKRRLYQTGDFDVIWQSRRECFNTGCCGTRGGVDACDTWPDHTSYNPCGMFTSESYEFPGETLCLDMYKHINCPCFFDVPPCGWTRWHIVPIGESYTVSEISSFETRLLKEVRSNFSLPLTIQETTPSSWTSIEMGNQKIIDKFGGSLLFSASEKNQPLTGFIGEVQSDFWNEESFKSSGLISSGIVSVTAGTCSFSRIESTPRVRSLPEFRTCFSLSGSQWCKKDGYMSTTRETGTYSVYFSVPGTYTAYISTNLVVPKILSHELEGCWSCDEMVRLDMMISSSNLEGSCTLVSELPLLNRFISLSKDFRNVSVWFASDTKVVNSSLTIVCSGGNTTLELVVTLRDPPGLSPTAGKNTSTDTHNSPPFLSPLSLGLVIGGGSLIGIMVLIALGLLLFFVVVPRCNGFRRV